MATVRLAHTCSPAAWCVLLLWAALSTATAAGQSASSTGSAATQVLTIETAPVAVTAGEVASTTVTLTINPPYHIMANPATAGFVATELTTEDSDFTIEADYPAGTSLVLGQGQPAVRVYVGRVTIGLKVRARAGAALGARSVPLRLSYQACSDKSCLPPKEIAAPLGVMVRVKQAEGEPLTAAAASGASALHYGSAEERLEDNRDRGPIIFLFFVFLAGLALNLTPCVFPLVPMTMGFFAAQGERRPARTFPLAAAYCLGLALTYTVLGVAAAKAGSQFGLVLESPWGVGAICVLMAALAASLFGFFEFRVPGRVLGIFQGRRGLLGALLMGLAVGLVAAPCVGPFLAALVVFVAGRGRAVEGAVTFFVLALGFGLPYLVLGTFTGLINRVPRGGGWLLWCKRALAFPVLGLVLYYLRPYLAGGVLWSLAAGLALAGAIYLVFLEGHSRRPWSKGFVIARLIVGALFLATAAGIFVTRAAPELGLVARTAGPEISWRDFAAGDLRAASAAGRPAVLFFTAKWCVYCRTMEEGPFREAEVRRAAEGVALLRIDGTNSFPEQGEAGELVRRYVYGGPPVLVFFDGRGREVGWVKPLNPKP